jgi:hypothetical protein
MRQFRRLTMGNNSFKINQKRCPFQTATLFFKNIFYVRFQKIGPLSINALFCSKMASILRGPNFMKYLTSIFIKFYTDLTVFTSELRC